VLPPKRRFKRDCDALGGAIVRPAALGVMISRRRADVKDDDRQVGVYGVGAGSSEVPRQKENFALGDGRPSGSVSEMGRSVLPPPPPFSPPPPPPPPLREVSGERRNT